MRRLLHGVRAAAVGVAFSMVLLFSSAYAACSLSGCIDLPKDVLVWQDGTVTVYFNSDLAPLDCTPRTDGGVQIDAGNAGRDGMLSTLLSAQLANRTVFVRIDNGSNPCQVRYVALRE